MFEYICRWSKSTISGAASAWFRLHWFCKHLKIEESERFSGPVLTAFFGCVAARAKEKAEQHRPNPAARGRKNGTTAETQVRNGLAFIMTNLCVDMPYLRANLVKKMIFSQRILPDPFQCYSHKINDSSRAGGQWEDPRPPRHSQQDMLHVPPARSWVPQAGTGQLL